MPARRAKAAAPPAIQPALCAVTWLDREIVIPPTAHTLAGFRAWALSDDFPERGRISFVGQEIFIDMSPEELETHNKIKTEVGYALVGLNKRIKLGEFYTDRALVTNVAANLSTEPDASFVTWESLESGRVHLVPREGEREKYLEVEGSPDWVLEIVSDSSVRKDTRLLRERYYRAGIPEYWLIDARSEELHFLILVRGGTGYEEAPSHGGWQSSPLFGRRFRLVRRRGRLGLWEYTLQVKPVR
jgi:Uma2 family endonuclease